MFQAEGTARAKAELGVGMAGSRNIREALRPQWCERGRGYRERSGSSWETLVGHQRTLVLARN